MSKPIDPQVRRLRSDPEGGKGSPHLLSSAEPDADGVPHRAKSPLRVLIAEDSEDDAKLVLRALVQGGFDPAHRRVQTAAGLQDALARGGWDAVLSDFNMPGFSGMDALRIFQSTGQDIPFILISGTIGEETAVGAMTAGASDYVMKKSLVRLAPALKRELEEAQMRAAHRLAQRDLVASEQRLRTVIETEPECVKVVSREGILLEMNAAGLAMLEAESLAAVQSKALLGFIVPEHRAAFLALHRRVIGGESGILEFEAIGLKGGRRWLETHAAPLRGANGEGATMLAVTRDITERVRGEEVLRRFASAMDATSDAIYLVDRASMRFVHVNEAACRMQGRTREEIFALGPDGVLATSRAELERAYDAMIASGVPAEPVEMLRPRKDGTRAWVELRRHAQRVGDGWTIVTLVRDITAQRATENNLRRFRTSMDVSGDGILLIDRASLRYIDVNQALCDLTGRTRDELIGMTPMEVFSADRATLERDYDALIADNDSSASLVEGEYRHKDGSLVPIETRRRALRTEDGWVIVGTARDISRRKAAESRIVQLNRVQAVLSGINALIVRVRDRDELFREACRIAVAKGGFRIAWIGTVDRSAGKIVPISSAGAEPAFLASISDRFPLGEGVPDANTMSAQAVGQKKAIVYNDIRTDPPFHFSKERVAQGILSIVALPLLVAGEAVGVLVLYASEAEFFRDDELRLLTELAGDVAFAIDHIEKRERLDYLAYYDELTGLANRTLFLERVAQFTRSAASGGHRLAVFLIDIERFKNINDSLGRAAGDELLRQAALWLKLNGGDANLIARVGADQFAMVLPVVKPAGDVARLLEKSIALFMEHPFRLNDAVFRVAVKVGAALFPDDGDDADTLLRDAEVALKKAKARGERYVFYKQKMAEGGAVRLSLENKLRSALGKEEFVLHYQPKVNLQTGKLTGAEALIRWNDPDTGLVPPGRFIPILEETGLIHEVGRWALNRALEDYLRWRAAGLPAVRIAVNVSPLQLRSRGFVAEIGKALSIDSHAAAGLELEITESLIMEDVHGSIATLGAIRDLGVTVAIDDFGTGFSSLSYLAKLPVDTLKIDRSFVTGMIGGPDGLSLVSTIIGLAHSFKLKVVAEGVETEEQSRLLRLLGCDEMQGFLFSKPVPADIFEQKFLVAPGAGQ